MEVYVTKPKNNRSEGGCCFGCWGKDLNRSLRFDLNLSLRLDSYLVGNC